MSRKLLSVRSVLLLVALSLAVVACDAAPTTPATPTATLIAPTATAAAPTVPAPTDTVASTATEAATAEPTQAPTAEATSTPESLPSPTASSPAPSVTANPAGSVWKPAGLAGQDISALALYAGGTNVVLAAGPTGAWRSEYDYTAWEALKVKLSAQGRVSTAAIGSPDVLYLTSNTGCASGLPMSAARSTDGGKTWQTIPTDLLEITASNATIAYGIACDGVYKTTNSGATWTKLAGSQVTNFDPHSIAVSPDGQQVYVAYTSEGGTGLVRRSTNAGKTWTDVTPKTAPGEELQAPSNLTFVTGSEGRPQDGGLHMASAQGIWFLPLESSDWKLMKMTGPDGQPQPDLFIRALYVDTAYTEEYNKPGPIIYVARSRSGGQTETGEGVLRSIDGGKTWQEVGKGLDQRVVTSLVLAPHDPSAKPGMVETLLAATTDGIWSLPLPPPFR